jgi:hypothetical protein
LVATPWLTLFSFLALSQTAHFGEHVVQMIQIHLLGLRGPDAQGLVGRLNIEWVHFIWNAWVLIALVVLVTNFRGNPWLIFAIAFAGWHLLEHAVIMATYLSTGVAGTPGLLGSGGAVFGGLPLARPDLHFLYNLVETVPILLAWRLALRRA